jgi:hypothetical protein
VIDHATGAKTLLFNTGIPQIAGLTGIPDFDGDGVADAADNCRFVANDQEDRDENGIGNACDNECPGENCDGSQETLAAPTGDIRPGDALVVTATFVNGPDDKRTIAPDCVNTTFTVTDGEGFILDPNIRERIYGTDQLITIPAGAQFSVTCDLTEMFDASILTDQGGGTTYTVQATYVNHIVPEPGVWTGAVTSNEITITIKGQPVTRTELDIEPFLFPNVWPCALRLLIPVAVLSTDNLDASKIDPKTVRFGKTGTEALDPTRNLVPANKRLKDVNGDGKKDMLFGFLFHHTGFSCNDIPSGSTSVTVNPILKGVATGGIEISASDALRLRR